jgi:hypothetical protein
MTARTGTISRVVLALVVAFVVVATLVPSVDAGKNNKNTIASVKQRIGGQRDICEAGGGTLTTIKRPGGTTATCTGGTEDGHVCVHSSKKTRCYQTREGTPAPPDSAPIVPVITGGASEPPPAPTGGGEDPPTDPPADPGGPIILFE